MNSVWKMNKFGFRWFLHHPLQFFKDFFRKIKWSYQRITKGYCDYDLFDMQWWLISILPSALREFAKNTHTYPGEERNGFTPESWEKYLLDMADLFEATQERECNSIEEIEADYKRMEECKNKAFDMMRDVFFSLFD